MVVSYCPSPFSDIVLVKRAGLCDIIVNFFVKSAGLCDIIVNFFVKRAVPKLRGPLLLVVSVTV